MDFRVLGPLEVVEDGRWLELGPHEQRAFLALSAARRRSASTSPNGGPAGAANVEFAEEQGSALAGAAAALTSETGTIGFVGGRQLPQIEAFRAGYEAGARAADPDVRIVATYVSASGDGFERDDLAQQAATAMYEQGADVVYHAAGQAGVGVIEAARAASLAGGEQRWSIGVDSDQYLEVDERLRPFVLTSMVKRYDHVTVRLVDDFLAGRSAPVPPRSRSPTAP